MGCGETERSELGTEYELKCTKYNFIVINVSICQYIYIRNCYNMLQMQNWYRKNKLVVKVGVCLCM